MPHQEKDKKIGDQKNYREEVGTAQDSTRKAHRLSIIADA
jgi:hypothetical protein